MLSTHTDVHVYSHIFLYMSICIKKKRFHQSNALNLGNGDGLRSWQLVSWGNWWETSHVQLAHVQCVRLTIVFCSIQLDTLLHLCLSHTVLLNRIACQMYFYFFACMRQRWPFALFGAVTQNGCRLAGTAQHGSVLSGRAGNWHLGVQEGQVWREEMPWEIQWSHNGRRAEPEHLGQHSYDDRYNQKTMFRNQHWPWIL